MHLLLLASIVLTFPPSTPQQAPDLCRTVTTAEVSAVLGTEATEGQSLIPGSCSWNGKGSNLLASKLVLGQPQEALMVVEARASAATSEETIKDEPGLGQRAASSLAANKRTLTLMIADAATVWTFTLSNGDQRIDVDAVLPRLREFAKKRLAAR